MSQTSQLITIPLVNKNDRIIGYREKFQCHKNPVALHRAVSVVVFDKSGKRILLQRRAATKPTWPLFWSNACCTHPFRGENPQKTAERRLKEEMGFHAKLRKEFKFTYKAKYDEVWGEHELDIVFTGNFEGEVIPNVNEVAEYKWIEIRDLLEDIKHHTDIYTPWFLTILQRREFKNRL